MHAMNRSHRWFALVLLIFWLLCGTLMAQVLITNQGHFRYTLDDPYIHLALAENIARGVYGVNLSEPSAPASSIIWPLLLVPFARQPWGDLVPLALNIVAASAALWVIYQICLAAMEMAGERAQAAAAALTMALVLTGNLLGLVFNGMEHVLQLLLALTVVLGLIRTAYSGGVPRWIWPALLLAPLVRYESAALILPALGVLWWHGEQRGALVCGALIAAMLAGFSLALLSAGLGALPTSVTLKLGGDGVDTTPLVSIGYNLMSRQGALLICLGLLLLLGGGDERLRAARGAVGFATILHILFGRIGWLGRYEIAAWGAALLMVVASHGPALWRAIFSGTAVRAAVALAALTIVLGKEYIDIALSTPALSQVQYIQQQQMARFATEYYLGNVAVNDLGQVSYHNDAYILDLYGLASREAATLRMTSTDPAWMERLAAEHDVGLIMIYDSWFDGVPPTWIKLGELRPRGGDSYEVSFYARPMDRARAETALDAWIPTLPPRAEFVR